jgi:hypothetical protein
MAPFAGNRRFSLVDVAIYAVGVAGLALCLTLIFLSMRAVMDIGGYCAEGGPYVIETHCPDGVPLLLVGGIFGLFGFGGLMVWKGAVLGDPYSWLVALAWPVLFLSLGWNFLQYALSTPKEEGIVWGWLIPGVLFVIMGAAPVLAVLPWGHSGRAGAARSRLASSVAPRSAHLDAERTDLATMMEKVLGQKTVDRTPHTQTRLVSELERLAVLHRSGDLSYDEFELAKRALLAEAGGTP